MNACPMPKAPEGHYWRINPPIIGEYWVVNLKRRRRWWLDTTVQWGVFTPVSDAHKNADQAVRTALYVLGKFHEGRGDKRAGLNGLTGYVDHKGVTR